MLEDITVTCPCCWQEVVLEVDLSGGSARYTEDCPVCCRPMLVQLDVGEDGQSFEVQVSPEND